MKFACPQCRKVLTVEDKFAGKRGRCPACKAAIVASQLPQSEEDDGSEKSRIPSPPPSQPVSHAQPSQSLPTPSSLSSTSSEPVPPPLPTNQPSQPSTTPSVRSSPKKSGTMPVPPPLPPEIAPPNPIPDEFWAKLLYCSEKERKELVGLIIGASIIGIVAGFVWGGLYDPWRNKSIATAVLNFFLFGGWGIVEVFGTLGARNFRLIKRRELLGFASALCGGLWVGVWSAIDIAVDPLQGGLLMINLIVGFLTGLIVGGGISIVSTLKITKDMYIPDEIVTHKPIRRPQQISSTQKSSNNRKIALWVGGGCLILLIVGGVIIGGIVYKTMNIWKETTEEFKAEMSTLDSVTPIPYQIASMDGNLLDNGTFTNLAGWERYDQTDLDDDVLLTAQENYVVWSRTNSQEESGAIGVYQENLNLDVSDTARLLLDVDVWVGGQTQTGYGEWTASQSITGEVPVHVEITYLDAQGERFLWDRGFMVFDVSMFDHIHVLEKGVWTHFSFDVMDDTVRINPKGDVLPTPATILKVMVYGNGWDFTGAIGNLKLHTAPEILEIQEGQDVV